MASLNKVQLIGHLGRDPESRTFPDGGMVTNMTVATSETWKDKVTGKKGIDRMDPRQCPRQTG